MSSAEKAITQGTHRSCLPEQTYDQIKPLLPLMGITRIANITGLDNIGIPVATACRPQSRAIAVAQGKGLSLIAAKVSAAMEAIETYHGEYIDLPLRLATYQMLQQTHPVVDCHRLARLSVHNWCPNQSILWIQATELTTDQGVYVPYEIVHCDFSTPFPAGSGAFMMSTNGLASGNTLDEACIHGICELIERDATTLWQLRRRSPQQKLDLATVDDPAQRQLLEKFAAADIHVSVWPITSDIGIPSFYCTIINQNPDQNRPLYASSGMGTHPSKAVALSRALTEAAQSRLTLISGSRDDVGAHYYQNVHSKETHHHKLAELTAIPTTEDYTAIDSWEHVEFAQDLQLLLNKLAAAGLSQTLVVNLTKPQFNIPVVRVIIPGLEGIHGIPEYKLGARGLAQLAAEDTK